MKDHFQNINKLFYKILSAYYSEHKFNNKIKFHEQALNDLQSFELLSNLERFRSGYKTITKMKFTIGHS